MEEKVLNGFVADDAKLTNFENLRSIIKNIAMCHSQEINKETSNVLTNKRKFDILKIVQQVISLKEFNGVDQASVDETVATLEEAVMNVMDSSILVKDQGIKEMVPLSYEVLRLIFISTNEKFRQLFFHELMDCYYNELCENIKKLTSTNIFSKEDYDHQVKVLLPIIKLETVLEFINNKDVETRLQEIVSNMTPFFKCSRMNQEDIYAVVNNKLDSKNYEFLSYEMVPLETRNGHLGDYFKLKINVDFNSTEVVLDLFAKFLTPKLDVMKELAKSGPSKKEEFFYLTYLPLLEKHGLHSLLDFSPRCYFSRLNDVLVLDDVMSQDFTALTPNIKLEFDGLMFVVKQIAKLHSCSMIIEELLSQESKGKKISLREIYGEYLKEVIFVTGDSTHFFKDSFESAVETIHYFANFFSELNKNFTQDELKERITKGWKLLFKQVEESKKFKNTICHGDMYVGNMLFKFDPNGTCHGATLVDFQILRYCPPVHDLLFFIHQNSLKKTRDKHYRQLVEEYYSELSRHLENFNLDIAQIYPKAEFEESLKYMKSQGVFQALFYSPLNALDPNLREEIFQNPEMAKKYLFDSKTALIDLGLESAAYREVISGLIEDIVDLCESGQL